MRFSARLHHTRPSARLGRLAALVLAASALAGPASADIVILADPPTFTAEDTAVIERNVSLKAALPNDPWAVRKVLDGLAALNAAPPAGAKAPLATHPAGPNEPPVPGATEPDPDLKRYQRANPEAAHDLLQIIKQAASGEGHAR